MMLDDRYTSVQLRSRPQNVAWTTFSRPELGRDRLHVLLEQAKTVKSGTSTSHQPTERRPVHT